MPRTDYSRAELIAICERAVVPVKQWRDRDSPEAQEKLGACWAMLKAGCEFKVRVQPDHPRDNCVTDARTIWLDVQQPTFYTFEDGSAPERELYFLPTPERLEHCDGRDWY